MTVDGFTRKLWDEVDRLALMAEFERSDTVYVGHSPTIVIRRLWELATGSGTDCIVTGLSGDAADILHSLAILGEVPSDRITKTFDEAHRDARDAMEAGVKVECRLEAVETGSFITVAFAACGETP